MNEIELEVFRAGAKASRGITSADIADLASSYAPETAPAAICIGHPKSDTPAHGTIASFRAEGNRLFATLKDVTSDVVDGIKSGKLLNRSMAFFGKGHEANPVPGKLYPRHLGFLGASAPGIPGMTNLKKALSFSADGLDLEVDGDPAPAIVFEADPDPTPTFTVHDDKEPTSMDADQIKRDREQLEADRNAFEATVAETRKATNAATVDGLVASGKLLPAQAANAKLIFDALDSEPLEFEAGKPKLAPSAALATLLSQGVALVDTTGKRLSPDGKPEFSAGDKADAGKIEAAARTAMKSDESLTFEAAVELVTKEA